MHTGAVIAEHALTWSPRHPTDLLQTIGALRRGGGDPTYHRDERGAVWRTNEKTMQTQLFGVTRIGNQSQPSEENVKKISGP